MTVLAVWTFADAAAARKAEVELASLSARGVLTIADGAVLTWPRGRRSPHTRQLQSLPLVAGLSSTFWGLLLGTVFFLPTLEPASDAAIIGQARADAKGFLRAIGLNDEFVADLRSAVTFGRSALFALLAQDPRPADDAFAHWAPQKCHVALGEGTWQTLRAVFS